MCIMNWLAVFLKVIYHMFLSVHFRIPMPLLCSNFDIRPGAPSSIFFNPKFDYECTLSPCVIFENALRFVLALQ